MDARRELRRPTRGQLGLAVEHHVVLFERVRAVAVPLRVVFRPGLHSRCRLCLRRRPLGMCASRVYSNACQQCAALHASNPDTSVLPCLALLSFSHCSRPTPPHTRTRTRFSSPSDGEEMEKEGEEREEEGEGRENAKGAVATNTTRTTGAWLSVQR